MLTQSMHLRPVNPSADLDEATLQQIATLTDGRYFRARDTSDLEGIYHLLDNLEPIEVAEETYRPVRELYPWPLAAALIITLLLGLNLAARSKTAPPAAALTTTAAPGAPTP